MPAALKRFLCLRRLNTKRDEVEVAKADRPQPRRGAPSSRKKTETRRHGDGVDKNVPPRNLISPKILQAEKTSRTSREFKIRLYGIKSITQSFLKLPPHFYKCGGKAKR